MFPASENNIAWSCSKSENKTPDLRPKVRMKMPILLTYFRKFA